MGFFKDFKEDFSQAVNELLPGDDSVEKEEEIVVNTLEQDVDVKAEMDKLEGLFESVQETEEVTDVKEETVESIVEPEETLEVLIAEKELEAVLETVEEDKELEKELEEDNLVSTEDIKEVKEENVNTQEVVSTMTKEVSDEVTVITAGTSLNGNIESTGSIEIQGQVSGNVTCNGKLTVTGVVKGNSTSTEFFADSAKIEGEIITDGTAKIGLGSVVIGNVTATSAVIAGAIKGDIDVRGPVVVDTSAVVMGNIKSRSVQINNGAVIEGFCSQCYADVDVNRLFDEK